MTEKNSSDKTLQDLVDECDVPTKLAVTAWVMKNIVDHATVGGTFRYLIYDRLGFGPEAYVPLYMAGGMTISNEFDLDDNIVKTETDCIYIFRDMAYSMASKRKGEIDDYIRAAKQAIDDYERCRASRPSNDHESKAQWRCPIKLDGCVKNCGDYGCGN